nr:immunoglobulin heavy chain junction region [Macaca mulatta]MOV42389.1 immunoglobulin heavy chain junction region [Macaca mulatta]MOV43982.1 immunoglobulin heavy chain junction region [Macaca mulatta]MOV45014.1 immunoglobulin heavy chain junction region [Macaca mulatta]MOV47274.1 immunoglobulin heavy chain junction region [Macaca mulatta]
CARDFNIQMHLLYFDPW